MIYSTCFYLNLFSCLREQRANIIFNLKSADKETNGMSQQMWSVAKGEIKEFSTKKENHSYDRREKVKKNEIEQ